MKKYKLVELENKKILIDYDEIDEERKNILKIYKENALIFGTGSKSSIKLTALDLKFFDLIYKFTQDKVRQQEQIPTNHLKLTINQNIVADYLNLDKTKSNSWKRDIEKSLTRLSDYKHTLKDYTHPVLGNIQYYSLSLIALPKITKNENDKSGRSDFIEIIIPDLIVISAWRKTKYTHISLNEINKLNSKYSIALYEYILSIKQYRKNQNNDSENIDISFEELKFIFSQPKPKFLSTLLQNVYFEKIVIKELNKIMPCKYFIYNKDKKITIQTLF